MSYPKEWAVNRWKEFLKTLSNGGTPVIEVRSFDLSNLNGAKKAIELTGKGVAIWQHNSRWHSVVMYIPKGKGKAFNRRLIDLYSKGIHSVKAFSDAWDLYNNEADMGTFPIVSSSTTSQIRVKQKSYIVADGRKEENKESKIKGNLSPNIPHRTHLLSAQTTGIESHKGLLIDYDGWLNAKTLNNFEQKILNIFSKDRDIIWTVLVYRDERGLVLNYKIYSENWELLDTLETVDDRWTYRWYYDEEQDGNY